MAKAVTATNSGDPQVVLSLTQARGELQIPAAVDIDAELIPQINEAAAWVGDKISAPVLDVERSDDLAPQSAARFVADRLLWRNAPITVYDRRWVREVVKVEWWNPDGNLSEAPNETLLPAQLGRTEILDAGAFQDTLQVFPPAMAGWPTSEGVLPGSTIRITTRAGLDMTEPYAATVRRGVVEAARQLNAGDGAVRFDAILRDILLPLMAV